MALGTGNLVPSAISRFNPHVPHREMLILAAGVQRGYIRRDGMHRDIGCPSKKIRKKSKKSGDKAIFSECFQNWALSLPPLRVLTHLFNPAAKSGYRNRAV